MSETSSSDGEPFAAGDDPWTAPLFPVVSGTAAAADAAAGARPRAGPGRGLGAQAQAPMGAAEDDGWGPGAGGLRVRVVTWNLNEIAPPEEDARLAVGENAEGDADVLVVAAQEGVAPGAWTKALLKATSMYGGECTTKVAVCAVGKISIAVFASERAVAEFVDVKTATVATGIGNVLSNKGGAGVLLTHASGARVAFVGAHLAAHQDEVKARNDSAKRILSKLNFDGATVADADAVVFAGDLNYRVEANRRVVDMLLGDFDTDLALDIMRRNDQLARARAEDRAMALAPFAEGFLGFRPTYKFDRKTERYDTSSKARVPSWTDRVLYYPDGPSVWRLLSYGSLPGCRHSDHRPVVAAFLLNLTRAPR